MPKKNDPWKTKWIKLPELDTYSGGLGVVSVVARACHEGTPERYALKVLKNQKSVERRERMHRESTALQAIDHPGVPRLIDSNTENFGDQSVDLYMVTEFIEGSTLEKYLTTTKVLPEVGLRCVIRLVQIVDYCHSLGIVHRDIKPDNVILRGNDPLDPVLIDFGQAFKREQDTKTVTYTGQSLGNRFLHLPELLHPGPDQRDRRPDLTQCCGILIYLLTGQIPRTLLDQDRKRPHERPEALAALDRLPKEHLDGLYQIFDRGFDQDLERRYQTAGHLIQDLSYMDPSQTTDEEQQKIARIRSAAGMSQLTLRNRSLVTQLKMLADVITAASREVASAAFSQESQLENSMDLDVSNLRFRLALRISHTEHAERMFSVVFTGSINGTHLQLFAVEESGVTRPMFSAAVEGEKDWLKCGNDLRQFFINGVYEKFAGRSFARLAHALPEPRERPMNGDEIALHLRQLPLRSIVAFASLCARNAASMAYGHDPKADPNAIIAPLLKAIVSAEQYARGDATAVSGEAAEGARSARSPGVPFDSPADGRWFHAGLAAANAAFTALFARQRDAEAAVYCAQQSYVDACSTDAHLNLLLIYELRYLLNAGLGEFPGLGLPVDPDGNGPLKLTRY